MAVNDINRMKELNELLAKAADAYYNTGVEIMSDKQYDDLYDELAALEKKDGSSSQRKPYTAGRL